MLVGVLAAAAQFLAKHAIVMFMLAVGLRTNTMIMRDLLGRRRPLVRALLVIWFAVPAVAMLILFVLRVAPPALIVLGVMAICPGVPLVLRQAKHAHGDAQTSLLILIATALTAIVMVPAWSWFLHQITPLDLAIRPRHVADVLVPLILVPYAVGRLVNVLSPRVASVLAPIADGLFVVGFVMIVVAVIAKRVPMFHELAPRDYLAAVLIPLCAAVVGYVAGAARPQHRISVAYAAALGNPMLAITALAHSAPGRELQAVPLVLTFLVLRALALIPFGLVLRKDTHASTHHDPPVPHPGGM